jgi:hypothetical protein
MRYYGANATKLTGEAAFKPSRLAARHCGGILGFKCFRLSPRCNPHDMDGVADNVGGACNCNVRLRTH